MANFSKSTVPQFSVDVYQNEYLPEGGREVNAIATVTSTGGGTIGSAVRAPHLYTAGQSPDAAVAIMVDCSGSMDYPPTKMRGARDATGAAIDALRDGVHFAVIGGTHVAKEVYPGNGRLAVADATTRGQAKQALRKLSAGGARNSPISSSILSRMGAASLQSKPTRAAFSCSFSARVSAGRATRHPVEEAVAIVFRVEAARQPGGALLGLLLGLDPLPHALGHAGAARLLVAEDMRVAADHLFVIACTTSPKAKSPCLLGHPGVVDDLQQQVAELVAQIVEIAARDRVGHLVGFLDRIGRDGREILLDVPGTAGLGIAQRRHDLDQAGNVAG